MYVYNCTFFVGGHSSILIPAFPPRKRVDPSFHSFKHSQACGRQHAHHSEHALLNPFSFLGDVELNDGEVDPEEVP